MIDLELKVQKMTYVCHVYKKVFPLKPYALASPAMSSYLIMIFLLLVNGSDESRGLKDTHIGQII